MENQHRTAANKANGVVHYANQMDIEFDSIGEELSTYQRAIQNMLEMPVADFERMKRIHRAEAMGKILNVARSEVNGLKSWSQSSDRDFGKSFRHQILDVSDSIIKKHISRSNNWSYKIGFCCHNCDFSWEVQHVINDLVKSLSDPCKFLDSCETKSPPCCLCPSNELTNNEEIRKRIETTLTGAFENQKAIEYWRPNHF